MSGNMKTVDGEEFKKYGKKLENFDFISSINQLEQEIDFKVPLLGNDYISSVPKLEKSPLYKWLKKDIFGNLPMQLGICAGNNQQISAVEYHMGSEVVIALRVTSSLPTKTDWLLSPVRPNEIGFLASCSNIS